MYAQVAATPEGLFKGLEDLARGSKTFSFGPAKLQQDSEKLGVDFAQVTKACASLHIDLGTDRLA